ncbi:DoxX family protein [Streptomyces sp. KM273126]|uniref:DoxX family protein n=1 Tax=Streptomyces sp. KM273126 TaxID=2545247 RepID=UPI00103BF531|nr:DoxX family protein [Streptomyces sp. KM273126]MBA2806835.1 DoxX family protein [Streptomyces sp. KM273126]
MNALLWTAQILLAAIFLLSGTLKATLSKERLLATGQSGVAPFPPSVIKLTAWAELAAVLGLVLPRLTGIAPTLTAVAAAGLMLVMTGALISHSTLLRADLRAGRRLHESIESVAVLTCLALLGLCALVVTGRS